MYTCRFFLFFVPHFDTRNYICFNPLAAFVVALFTILHSFASFFFALLPYLNLICGTQSAKTFEVPNARMLSGLRVAKKLSNLLKLVCKCA